MAQEMNWNQSKPFTRVGVEWAHGPVWALGSTAKSTGALLERPASQVKKKKETHTGRKLLPSLPVEHHHVRL